MDEAPGMEKSERGTRSLNKLGQARRTPYSSAAAFVLARSLGTVATSIIEITFSTSLPSAASGLHVNLLLLLHLC
jgi:hypothetical protein